MHNVITVKITDGGDQKLHEFYFSYIAYLRAAYIWFHSAHHTTRGVSFSGDHVNLYPKIYEFFSE